MQKSLFNNYSQTEENRKNLVRANHRKWERISFKKILNEFSWLTWHCITRWFWLPRYSWIL